MGKHSTDGGAKGTEAQNKGGSKSNDNVRNQSAEGKHEAAGFTLGNPEQPTGKHAE